MLHRLSLPIALAAALAMAGCSSIGGAAPADPAGSAQAPQTAQEPAAESSASMDQQALSLDSGVAGVPAGSGASIDDVLRGGAIAMWTGEPGTFTLTVPASSTCIPSVFGAEAVSASQIAVELVASAGPCPEPDEARTYELRVPDGADASGGLEILVGGIEDAPSAIALPAP